jgi:hypothetical protein
MIKGSKVVIRTEANDRTHLNGKIGEIVDMHRSAIGTVCHIVRIGDGPGHRKTADYDFAGSELLELVTAPSELVDAYTEAMLWSSSGRKPACETCGDNDSDCRECELESLEGFELSSEAQEQAQADCDAFWTLACDLVTSETRLKPTEYTPEAMAGHDFWLTRVGHGCGFWDGDWRDPEGEKLTKLAKLFGERWPYLGDDSLVYVSG